MSCASNTILADANKKTVVNGLASWAIVVIAIAPRPQFERQLLLHQRHS